MAKILVVEDEVGILEEVETWLEVEGYEVLCAENGRKGLDLIYNEQPDLVLCDINMPEMDGHQVLIELRSNSKYAQLPFIFLTAAADRTSVREGMNLGADDYITKPFSYADVISTISTRLAKRDQIQSRIENMRKLIDDEREMRLLKSRMIGMFSHDFRNPLSSILSASNILQRYADRMTPEQQQKRFQHIDGAVYMLLQMLDEMLMVAEIENGKLSYYPQLTDLNALLHKTVDNFCLIDDDRHPIILSIDLPESVVIDANLVQHILSNLMSNALKYSPEGSTVILEAYVDKDQIIISIQDEGIGIPADEIQRLFEPFFRAANSSIAKGTGLGLALVKQAVDVCGGTIDVVSEIDRGTRFTLTLPLLQA